MRSRPTSTRHRPTARAPDPRDDRLPAPPPDVHHALADARWTKVLYDRITLLAGTDSAPTMTSRKDDSGSAPALVRTSERRHDGDIGSWSMPIQFVQSRS